MMAAANRYGEPTVDKDFKVDDDRPSVTQHLGMGDEKAQADTNEDSQDPLNWPLWLKVGYSLNQQSFETPTLTTWRS